MPCDDYRRTTLMVTAESAVDGVLPAFGSGQATIDRKLVRRLLRRHSKHEISQIIEEELTTKGKLRPDQYSKGMIRPSASTLSKSQGVKYTCGICAEEGIHKTCTRINDPHRHIKNFHNSNAIWSCQSPGCELVFDWQNAYHNHLRHAHDRSRMNANEAKIFLCKQSVFACGFEQCAKVFETSPGGDSDATLKDYSNHIVRHLEQKSNSGQWSYSTRLRNLLRQSRVTGTWEMVTRGTDSDHFCWEPQSTVSLRKRLETQHLENLDQLIREAILLGSNKSDGFDFPARLELPYKSLCRFKAHKAPSARGSPSRDLRQKDPQHSSTRPFVAVQTTSMSLEFSTLGSRQSTQFEPCTNCQPEIGWSDEYTEVPLGAPSDLHAMASYMLCEPHVSTLHSAQPVLAGCVSPGPSSYYCCMLMQSFQPEHCNQVAAPGYPNTFDANMRGTSSRPPDVEFSAHRAYAWAAEEGTTLEGNYVFM